MFKPFLEEVAQQLIQQFGNQLHEICIVSPNRRAQVFLDAYFRKHIQKPTFSPDFTTINKFIQDFSSLQTADQVILNIRLYEVYCKITKSKESFDNFFFWGEILLNDFNDIDKQFLNAEDLFKNVASLKEMQDSFDYLTEEQKAYLNRFLQSFNFDKLSHNQKDFIEIWRVLFDIYTQFRQLLMADNLAYEGMIYREMAEKIESGTMEYPSYNKVVFIGFNALNDCEHKLFDWLQKTKKAIFFWDYDQAYINNWQHEAGRLLRKNITDFKEEYPLSHDHLYRVKKNISIIQTSSESAQAAIIPAQLKTWMKDNPELSQSALVLANEGLLTPVLNSIPEEVSSLNITMGYPIIYAQCYSYLMNLLNALNSCLQNFSRKAAVNIKFLMPLLQHPYYRLIKTDIDKVIRNWQETNHTYLKASDLQEEKVSFFDKTLPESANEIADLLFEAIQQIVHIGKDKLTDLEFEQIFKVYTQVQRLKDVLCETNIQLKPRTFIQFLRKYLKKLIIPYYGEPLSGLQVMGILETRTIDFKHLIVLSLNENNFPKSSYRPSFIPPGLRNAFGLPTAAYHDAIYAYYFYRLIQRAENICLVYNASQTGSSREASRYIQQLVFDPQIETNELSINLSSGSSQTTPVSVQKSELMIEWLASYLQGKGQKHLSPTAINTYIDCSLKFYFKYFLRLELPDEFIEEIDALNFGNIIHDVMQKIYDQLHDKTITDKIIDQILEDTKLIIGTIDQFIEQDYMGNRKRKLHGNDIIIREVLIKVVQGVLIADKSYTPFTIKYLEEKFQSFVPLSIGNVQVEGKIDRIDEHQGATRILDYKTGSVHNTFSCLDELFIPKRDRPRELFQVFMYALMYCNNVEAENIEPGLFYTKELFKNNQFDYRVYQKIDRNKQPVQYRELKNDFANLLKSKLNELFDPETPFSQVEDLEVCTYCDFKLICNR